MTRQMPSRAPLRPNCPLVANVLRRAEAAVEAQFSGARYRGQDQALALRGRNPSFVQKAVPRRPLCLGDQHPTAPLISRALDDLQQ